tara:strand:- start:2694 stop:2978 length:285 start_codon:yes stop_codon:yes gene_type:complete
MYYVTYKQILLKAEREHRLAIINGAVNCITKAVKRWLALLKIRKSIANKKQEEKKKVTFNEFKKPEKEELEALTNDIDILLDKLKEKINIFRNL